MKIKITIIRLFDFIFEKNTQNQIISILFLGLINVQDLNDFIKTKSHQHKQS